MSRFGADDYWDEEFPNQGELWWENIRRALSGKRGQQALRDLEEALVTLPEPRLVRGHVATKDGGVCAVGALILHRRLRAGEKRQAILDELARLYPETDCWCGHGLEEHRNGGEGECASCSCFKFDEWVETDGGDRTAGAGVSVGLTYALAWRLAYLNDDDYADDTPEERYEHVLAWVRKAQVPA